MTAVEDRSKRASITDTFSVDLEEWFNTQNLRSIIRADDWSRCESRIERQTHALLELLERRGARATFFVLGWVAAQKPALIREIAAAGHEIATHGYAHLLLTEITPDEFRRDLMRALEAIEGACGCRVLGYRAPAFTVTARTLWALDILEEFGMRYDSSVFPIGFHPEYGMPDAPLEVHRRGQRLIEVPMSCAVVAGRRVPIGGGYFRQLPYALSRRLIDRCHRQGRSVNFYIHPWEIDPDFPRLPVGPVERFRHYRQRHTTLGKLEQLLLDYSFTSIDHLIGREQHEEQRCHDGLLLRGTSHP